MSDRNVIKEMYNKQFDKDINYNEILSKIEGAGNMKKILTMVATVVIIFLAGFSTYASLGGQLFGKPIIEWLGIKFSDQYNEYIVEDNQNVSNCETSLNLISKVCDDGFTILEFNLTISDTDKEKLNLYNTTVHNLIDGKFVSKIAEPQEVLKISFNNEIVLENGANSVQGLNNFSLIIDGIDYWVRPRSIQTITKISENEFRIYQMYFLTDKELEQKTEFVITLNNVALYTHPNDCIVLNGNFEIQLSKNKAIENAKTIYPEKEEVKYKKMTKTIDKVTVTPLQTIVKVTSIINDVSLISLESTRNKNYIGLCDYKVYDQTGNQLLSCNYEIKRTIQYEDGTTEEWEQGDIGTYKEFENAQMKLIEYIIVEKNSRNQRIKNKTNYKTARKWC